MNKIAIIGAGWYGCHIGLSLKHLGFDVTVFEKNEDVLTCASGNNQFRLHLGFHYARNYATRIQSRDGYQRFVERYPTLTKECQHGNIYAVPALDSLVDFKTYKLIMTASGIEFNDIPNPEWSNGLAGSVSCSERVILTQTARDYFKDKLAESLKLNTPVESVDYNDLGADVNGKRFDFVIDCTWGHYRPARPDTFYEPTILLYYSTKEKFPAFTLVDGPLASIYPTETNGIYTLSSVTHTPLATFDTAEKARKYLESDFNQSILDKKIELMEEHICKYVPNFRDMFTYESPQLAIKTKIIGATDDRSCSVVADGRYISVMSGKIDTIFHGLERVIHHIESYTI